MSSTARVYGAIQVLHAVAGLATHDPDHLRAAAAELDDAERDAIEQGCLRFVEQCVRIREDRAAVAPPHVSATAYGDPSQHPCMWMTDQDCKCPIGRDHWQDRRYTRLMGMHSRYEGDGILRMVEPCSCSIGHDHEKNETKETQWPSTDR